MTPVEIISANYYSINFPTSVKNEIVRDNIISTIEDQFNSNSIIFLTGEDEIGKTTFLSQFAKNHNQNCISCFIKPVNAFSSKIENIILDIITQAHFILYNSEYQEDYCINFETLEKYFNAFIKNFARRTIYIILDGLEDIEEQYSYQIKEILNIFPFGYKNFKFLFSDSKKVVHDTYLKEIIKKGKFSFFEYPLSVFSLDEIQKYLSEFRLLHDNYLEIRKITKGIPGKVKVVYDILNSGKSFEESISNLDNYSDLINQQWNEIDKNDEVLLLILAFICFEESGCTISDLASFIKQPIVIIEQKINNCHLIEKSNEFGTVLFKSSIIKKYVKIKLASYKNTVEESIIEYLYNAKNEINAVIELPKRLEKNKKFDEILHLLTEDNFKKILNEKESLSFIIEQTEIGINAATYLKKYSELFKLCYQKALISEIKQIYIYESEIEVKFELGNYEEALDLARGSILKEDKFKFLVFLSKKRVEKKLPQDDVLFNDIHTLYPQIDPKVYKDYDEIIDICSNLLYSFPSYAIEFLENAIGNENLNEKSDIGFARLAMTLHQINNSRTDGIETIDTISSKIKNPKLKDLTGGFSFLFGEKDVLKFINKLNEISSNSEKLQLARIYLDENKKNNGIEKVINFAIDLLLIMASENPITASILDEISRPLPYLNDINSSFELISRLESYTAISKEKGPSIRNIKFQLNLFSSEIKFNFNKARNRIYEIYSEVLNFEDISIRVESFALIFRAIRQFDPNAKLEINDSFETQVFEDFLSGFDILLTESAQHFSNTRRIIKNIAFICPSEAILLCLKLNTRKRRDNALLFALRSYLKNEIEDISFNTIENFYKKIVEQRIKDFAALEVLEKFNTIESKPDAIDNSVIKFINRIKDFQSNEDKCVGYGFALKLFQSLQNKEEVLLQLNEEIDNYFYSLDDRYEKINNGFRISVAYLKINKELARKFHNEAQKERQTLELDSPISLTLFHNTLRLAIKAFSGLFHSKVHSEDDAFKLIEYINYMPSKIIQLNLISELLLRIYNRTDIKLFHDIFNKFVNPYISTVFSDNFLYSKTERINLLLDYSLVFYFYQPALFFEFGKKLYYPYSDFYYNNVCRFLLFKQLPFEYYDSENDKTLKMDYVDTIALLDIIDHMSIDNIIYQNIDFIRGYAKRNCFTRENLIDISARIEVIINNKFPDNNNIKHNGYKIISKACLLNIRKNESESDWNDLIHEAEAIPNQSDKCFVLSTIASNFPTGIKHINKAEIILKSLDSLDNIKSYISRVERYKDLTPIFKDINPADSKERIKRAITDSTIENNDDLYGSQKALIDFAYENDPNLAEELIKIIDDDPARKPLSERLKQNLKTLKLKKALVNDKELPEKYEVTQLNAACGLFIEQLNSGRVYPKKIEDTIEWIIKANSLPLSESFSIFYAYLSNSISRFNNSNNSKSNLQPLFDHLINNIQLIKILSLRNKKNLYNSKEIIIRPKVGNNLTISVGEDNKGIEFIKSWLTNNLEDYITICDPYFTSDDLSLIKEICLIKPEVRIIVLGQNEGLDESDLKDSYIRKWAEICEQEPPDIRFVIVSCKKQGGAIISPNHDRWLISKNSGLRLGTSFSGLGKRNTEISIMSFEEAKNIESEFINKYVAKIEKYHLENRLSYMDFDLF